MTLGFKQYHEGQPTNFPEMILTGLGKHQLIDPSVAGDWWADLIVQNVNYPFLEGMNTARVKIHTLREDDKNLWQVGKNIHFVVNNRTANRYQFAPVLEVNAIQTIEMKHTKKHGIQIWIDGFYRTPFELHVKQFVQNDGFETMADFSKWFEPILLANGKKWKGKIIHWTDLKY